MKRTLLFTALIVWSGMASAVVYRWIDAQGKLQYGDLPPDGVHAEVVELPGNHAAHTANSPPPRTPESTPSNPPAGKGGASGNSSTAAAGAQQAVDEDVAQAKQKQCADAQDYYKKLIEGRKLYKAGPDGERQYMTSEEIDAARLNAKRDVDTICNSPT